MSWRQLLTVIAAVTGLYVVLLGILIATGGIAFPTG